MMLNSEGVVARLDGMIAEFNLKLLSFGASLLFKPLATASDPMFRDNLGERYFSMVSASLGGALWIFAVAFGNLLSAPISTLAYESGWHRYANWLYHHQITSQTGLFILVYFFARAGMNLKAVKKRREQGIPWHSYSRGTLRFRTIWIEYGVFVSASFFLLIVTPPVGLLLIVSRLLSYFLERQERESLYAQYLDRMDALIMNQSIEPSLRDAPPADKTQGLYYPLPKSFQGEQRTYVAKVIARDFPPPADEQIDDKPGKSREAKKPASPSSSPKSPEVKTPPAAPSAYVANSPSFDLQAFGNHAAKLLGKLVMSTKVRGLMFLLVALVIIGEWGIPAWHSISTTIRRSFAYWTAPKEAKAALTPETPHPSVLPKAALPAANPDAVVTPISAPSPQTLSAQPVVAEVSVAHTAVLNPPKYQTDHVKEVAALNAKATDRASIATTLGSLVESNAALLSVYGDQCRMRNTDNIARSIKLASSSRSAIQKRNRDLYATSVAAGSVQGVDIEQLRLETSKIQAGLEDDPKGVLERAIAKLNEMATERQAFLDEFDLLDADIAKAPKKRGLFD